MEKEIKANFENTNIEMGNDLSELWHDLNFSGNALWDMVQQIDPKKILSLRVVGDGKLNMGGLEVDVKSGGRVVYYPPNTDMKNEHFSKFYKSLSKEKKNFFTKHFSNEITNFYVFLVGRDLN